jgi:DNA repair photolyase
MTVSTDSRRVQRAFEPHCAAPQRRLRAITQVAEAGVNTSITMTPLLPIEDIETFTKDLLKTGVQHFVVQPFHADRGKFVAGTRPRALHLIADLNWTDANYQRIVKHMHSQLPILEEGREGFAPE